MGRKLDATNSLYAPVTLTSGSDRSGESSVIRAITGAAAADKKPIEQVPAAMRDTLTVKEPVIENAPLDLDLDFDATPTASNSAAASSLSPNTAALDFDLGEPGTASSGNNEQGETPSSSADPFVLDFDLDAPSPTPANRDGAAIGESTAMADIGLDFDLDIGLTSEKQMDVPLQAEDAKPDLELGSSVDLPPLDLSDIDLNLGSSGATNAAMAEKAGGNWQSAETKLDLARAYLEIGDKVGAVEILQEVIKEGSTEQQEEAKKLAAQA